MAAVRHNRPTIIVYGGTIQAGTRHVGSCLTFIRPSKGVDRSCQIVLDWGSPKEEL